jgi:hypothetical protein
VKARLMEEPVFYGYSRHYDQICCWGATDQDHLLVKDDRTSLLLDSEEGKEKPVLLSDVLLSKKTILQPINKDLKFDFKSYRTKSRTSDVHLWPQPNLKAIATKKTLAEMMTVRYVIKDLAGLGIIPVVTLPNPSQREQLIKIPFGPMLDNHFQHMRLLSFSSNSMWKFFYLGLFGTQTG